MANERHSQAWWRKTIAEFTSSGLNRQDFAARRGVHPESIRQWRRKLGAVPVIIAASAASPGLVRIELPEVESDAMPAVVQAMVGPAELRFTIGTDAAYVGALIAAIGRAVGRC